MRMCFHMEKMESALRKSRQNIIEAEEKMLLYGLDFPPMEPGISPGSMGSWIGKNILLSLEISWDSQELMDSFEGN